MTASSMAQKMKEVRSRSRLTSRAEALKQFHDVEEYMRLHTSLLSLKPSASQPRSVAGSETSKP